MNGILNAAMMSDIKQYRRAVQLTPRDARAHALLGLALLKDVQLDEGIACLRRALELNPKLRDLRALLAAALLEGERYEEAADAFRQALHFEDDAELHRGLANSLVRLQRAQEAEPSARRAVELAPHSIPALLCLASTLHGQGNFEDTAAVFRQVLALDPEQVDAQYDLGDMLYRLNRHDEAIECYRAVVARRPGHVNAHRHMGLSHRHLRQHEAALACLERAVELVPDNVGILCDFGATLQMNGNLDKAAPILRKALAIDTDNEHALRALAHTCFTLGEWQEALGLSRRLLEVCPTPETHSMLLFILSHCCLDPDELTREHFGFGERWEATLRTQWQPHPNDRDPMRQLRVGFVSADLYNHAVSHFIAPLFQSLKGNPAVALHVYYNNTFDDAISREMRANVAVWRPIADLDDDAAERLIRADGIDILIDLSGHSARNRLPLFARKPAPIQATYIGYAGTTGLRSMDYILCDQFLVPEGRYDNQFTEQIVRLPSGALFLPEPSAPPVNELPALKNGYLTFGSFHRASKLSRDVIAHWAKLLHAVPDARMLLGGLQSGIDDRLIDWFELEGIPRERLLLRPRAPVHEYLKQHYDVDVCLSPFPYTGSTTIGHALWMGVPTLAATGPTNPSHAAAVFMVHLGLGSFITEDDDTYVKLGVFLAQNTQTLALMRMSMRQRMTDSILGYPDVAAAGLALALRKMWLRWCNGQGAAPLQVRLAELVSDSE
ncbi:tetratricopeptide repeat protein [Massilia putida]|uniref:tetratricopeptide repeat protein n=1 Tax=Massilia putida TaxID=1141883 RepID=UPI000951413D|nr:glycosyltransferase family 41 protein [Massilia putida]